MTITEKRAKLFKEWTLATMANDERYYLRTLTRGIPDGNTPETTLQEICQGEYDRYIDNLIGLYEESRCRYGGAGYVIDGVLSFPWDPQYKRLMYTLPARIYKHKHD